MVRKLQLAIIAIIFFTSQAVFGLGLGYDRGGGGFIRDDPNASYEYFLFLNYEDANSISVSAAVATIDSDIGGGWTYTDPNLVCVTDTTDIVGIGTASPGAKLDIHPHAAGIIGLNIDAYAGYTANYVRLRDPNDNNLVTIDKDGDIATSATISANSAVLTGDTNTFDITSGTGSLNVAAGKTVDIDMDLTIDGAGTTITGADQANTITLNESFTIGGGANFTLTAEDTAGTITLDEQTFEVEGQGDNTQLTKIINVNDAAATISIEGTSAVVNQDTTSDGSPSFTKVTTTEIEYSGDITIDAIDSNTSHFNISNSGAGNAQLDLNGAQITSDALSDVASIGMLDEGETVTGAWVFTDSTSAITIGDGTAGEDPRIYADGNDYDGSITYMEDEDRWYFTEGINLDGASSLGAWGYTGEHIALTDSSSNTNAGLGEYFEISSSITAGKVMAAEYSRLMCRTAQTNYSTLVGTESQFRLYGVNLANGVHAGLWAYAEQSGTSVLSGGGTFDAISATVESASGFETGATEHVTGITLDSSINAGATINASTNFSGIYIKSNGKDWFDGIYITGATNDIKLKNGATINNTSADLLTITEPTVDVDGDLTAGSLGISKDAASAEVTLSTYHDTEATSPTIIMRKAEGTEASHATPVDDNAVLGIMTFQGYDGSGWHEAARIEARIDGTPSDGTDMPGELSFWTVPDGSATAAERMSIDDSGNVNITNFFAVGVNAHETISVNGTTKSIQAGIHGDDVADKFCLYADRGSDTHTSQLVLARARGSHASPTQVADDDKLGVIGFMGWDDTDNDMNIGAQIFARVNGTPGNDDLPTELVFATTADSNSTATERMTISNAGTVDVVGDLTAGTVTSDGAITANGTLHGLIEIIADDNSLSAAQCKGSLNKLNGAETTTLPAAVAGMNVLLYSDDATVKTIDPNGNDHIWLNGVDLTAGVSINSPGAVGDYIVLVAFADNNWYSVGQSGVWVVTP